MASALLALLAAVPGREPERALPIGASVAMVAAIATLHASAPASPLGSAAVLEGWPCAARTLAVAAVPWVILLLAVRRGATIVPARAGLLAGAATLLVAAAVIRVVCPSDERWHLLVFHLGPVVLGIMASLAMGLRCTSAGAAADDASTARVAKPCVPDVRRQARQRNLD